ncbi:MAG: hypothetical protein QNK80_09595, partial [Akkermansiaceae bacterium]
MAVEKAARQRRKPSPLKSHRSCANLIQAYSLTLTRKNLSADCGSVTDLILTSPSNSPSLTVPPE